METLILRIIDNITANPTIKAIVITTILIIFFFFLVRIFSRFLQDLDVLELLFIKWTKRLFSSIYNITKLILNILFFPIFLVIDLLDNKNCNVYIINNSRYKEC